MRAWIFTLPFLLLLVACQQRPPVSGHLQTQPDWATTVYLIQALSLDQVAAPYQGRVIDSASIAPDGRFSFSQLPEVSEPILLHLAVQRTSETYPNRLDNENPATDNYFPFVWQNGERIRITASIDRFQSSFSIQNPSPANRALLQLRDIRQEAHREYLQDIHTEAHNDQLLLEREATVLSFRQQLMGFARTTDHLLPALTAIRWISPENDYERVPEFLVEQCKKWSLRHPKHPWVTQLCEKAAPEALPVLVGGTIPNGGLPMTTGDTLNLYALLGKQLTLLDLWASWCAPCRKENREVLVPLWEEYQDQGFQIVGYALDGNEKQWKAAIRRDGADRWPQTSHLGWDDAPYLQALRIQTIPANFLVDGDGKVLAKNLHGEKLSSFIQEYFKK